MEFLVMDIYIVRVSSPAHSPPPDHTKTTDLNGAQAYIANPLPLRGHPKPLKPLGRKTRSRGGS